MSVGKLYGKAGNTRFAKPMIVAELSGITVDTLPNFEMKEIRSESYLAKFPLGQAPGFEAKDGKLLTESCAIAQYIAEQKPNNPLLGQTSWERAEILRFSLIGETQILANSLEIIYPVWGLRPYNQDTVERSLKKVLDVVQLLDQILKSSNSQYICCDRLTLADIELVCALTLPFCTCLTPEFREMYPNLTSYFKNISELPAFKKHNFELENRGYSKGPVQYKQ